jgi:transcriptional regulator with XRE-family HTH domain
MKPHELIAALMKKEGLGPLPLARKLGNAGLQPQIHRFWRGEVPEPKNSTAAPLAKYFNIPLEAIYDEKVATLVAKERGLSVVPLPAPRAAKAKQAAATGELDEASLLMARRFAKLGPAERARFENDLQRAYERAIGVPPSAAGPLSPAAPRTTPERRSRGGPNLTGKTSSASKARGKK